jgi:hypothetical protein
MQLTLTGVLSRMLEQILEAYFEKLRKSITKRVAALIYTQG